MRAFYDSLPSEKMMKAICHSNGDQWLAAQASGLLFALTATFVLIFSLVALVTCSVSFIAGNGFTGNFGTFSEWLVATLTYCFGSAAVVVAVAVFIKFYLRSQFGLPVCYSEMQADLDCDQALEVCGAYMHEHALDETMQADLKRGRLIALMSEGKHTSTFLEITILKIDADHTFIAARSASTLAGKAALLSAFYNDFGHARDINSKMMESLSPHASLQRRPIRGASSSKQALPAISHPDYCPPPLSVGGHKGGRRLSARPNH